MVFHRHFADRWECLKIDFNDAGGRDAVFNSDHGDRYRIAETPVAGTSRVEIGDAIFLKNFRLMGMPADDHMDTGSRRFHIQVV